MSQLLRDRFREATAFHRAGALDQAEEIYRELLREDPEHAGAWHRLGLVFHSRRELAAAIKHIEQALLLCDSKAVYWNNYGAVLKDAGRHEDAKEAFEKAVEIHPDYADAWSNLGLIQTELGHLEEAERSIRRALQVHPQHLDALAHLAVLARERGNFNEALRLCKNVSAIAPAKSAAYDVAGSVFRILNRFEEAAASHRMARNCDPTAVDKRLNLGFAYADLGETEKARQTFETAAELRPDLPMWRLRHLGLCPTIFRSFAEMSDYRLGLERQLDEALANPPPFDWGTALRDGFWPSFQLSHHGICNRGLKEKYAQLFAPAFPGERPKLKRRRRIRIGFTCTPSHEGGFIRGFGGIMERLDRKSFEVVGLVSQSIVPFCRSRVRANETEWIGIPHNLQRALKLFTEADCDVVMHWHAGTDIVNYFLPFLPLAPVQCIGFGMHGTTGIANIDYFVSSQLFERGREADDDYTESLVQFSGPTSWQARPLKPEPAVRSDFGLPETGTLYFCPQRHQKFHPDFDSILREILEQDRSGYVLVLQGRFPRTAELLRARLADALGETLAARVLFIPKQTPPNYYRLLSLADVVLDTPAYSASLTGYDAFSLGIPIVTLPGRYMVQRYARGLYSQMGISDLVAGSEDEYIELAARLGCEDGFRETVSQRIVDRSALLYECGSVVGEYERFFIQATEKASR